ncbi:MULTISPECIES: phage protein Gp37 [Serratia]|uniref:phage protein Gp37 n=1 Tax=Serratia TaxID=613 RepID=UPI00066125C2|nr:phage protein Gp37 [Serratia sp. 506_PEND]
MIAETENALLARITTLFGNRVRRVDTHPGDWSDKALQSLLITAPAVYVAWLGGERGRTRSRMDSRWVCYVCGQVLNGHESDRMGIYQMVGLLIGGLEGFSPGTPTPMRYLQAQNLYTDAQGASGVAMYGVYFSCEEQFAPLTDLNTLDDFLRHYQTFGEPDGTPPFEAHIDLPSATENLDG